MPRHAKYPYIDDFVDNEVYVFSTIGQGPAGPKGEKGDVMYPEFAEPIDWDIDTDYPKNIIVLYEGASYLSKQAVPHGTEITNDEYWAITNEYNAQIKKIEDTYGVCFDTVSEMREYKGLKAGTICTTLGFYNVGIGGGVYEVVPYQTPNDMNIIEYVENELCLKLVDYDTLSTDQIGCPRHSEDDVSDYLSLALSLSDNVFVPAGTYKIASVKVPKNKHIYGESYYFTGLVGSTTRDGGTVIDQYTEDPCFITSHCCTINNFRFKSSITHAIDEDTMSVNANYVIYGNEAFNAEIYNIGFLGVNKGIGFDNTSGVFNSIGILNIHDIYGAVYTTCIHIFGASDYAQVYNVNLTVQSGITWDSSSDDFKYVRKHMTVLDLGRTDYSVFDSVKAFVARYGVYFHYDTSIPSHPRGSHNALFSNLEFDCVGTAVYTPYSSNIAAVEASFSNCVFTNGLASAFSPATYEAYVYGKSIIDVNDGSMIQISNCIISADLHVATAKNKAKLSICSCTIRDYDAFDPADYVAFLVAEDSIVFIGDCKVYQLSQKNNSGLVKSDGLGYIRFFRNFFTEIANTSNAEYTKENIVYSENQFSSIGLPNIDDYDQFLSAWNLPDFRVGPKMLTGSVLTVDTYYDIPMHKDFLSKFKSITINCARNGFVFSETIAMSQVLDGASGNNEIRGYIGETAAKVICKFVPSEDKITLRSDYALFVRIMFNQ